MITKNRNLQKNINLLRWTLPLLFTAGSAFYQLVIARFVHETYGEETHWIIEIIFYGTAASLITLWVLTRIGRWLEEKEQFEREAHASERRLAAISYASADAILGIDDQGCISSWNRGAELIFGHSTAEIVGQPLANLFEGRKSANEESRWLQETVQREGILREHETICLKSSGERVHVEITATNLDPEYTEKVEGFSMILRDITRRKKRETEISRLNQNLSQQVTERTQELAEKITELAKANTALQKLDQMRSEFVSLVSHQIRAPLTNMGGAVQRMQAGCSTTSPTCNRMFSILNQQVVRLDQLVQDVLNVARLETGELSVELEPLSVTAVIDQVLEQVRARNTSRPITFLEKPGLPYVYADRAWVAEVLINLIDNADKYSPPGEEISLELSADQKTVSISVRDHGPGVPKAEQALVFDKFYRTDSSDSQPAYGYGLGLYICRMLVEAQGGNIWVSNHPSGGAIFAFNLPVWKEK
jgi:PAS domain S-box-containing protein